MATVAKQSYLLTIQKRLNMVALAVAQSEGYETPAIGEAEALERIREALGYLCSICRRRHGSEVEHACE
jgi:hypothetical protein